MEIIEMFEEFLKCNDYYEHYIKDCVPYKSRDYLYASKDARSYLDYVDNTKGVILRRNWRVRIDNLKDSIIIKGKRDLLEKQYKTS